MAPANGRINADDGREAGQFSRRSGRAPDTGHGYIAVEQQWVLRVRELGFASIGAHHINEAHSSSQAMRRAGDYSRTSVCARARASASCVGKGLQDYAH
jgi:hypothetical protein